jgi:hypothetical protein
MLSHLNHNYNIYVKRVCFEMIPCAMLSVGLGEFRPQQPRDAIGVD